MLQSNRKTDKGANWTKRDGAVVGGMCAEDLGAR